MYARNVGGDKGSKHILIDRLPKCLIIHLKRWKLDPKKPPVWSKDSRNINYTETIYLSSILTEEGELESDPDYTLRGVLEHDGVKDGGHFTNLVIGHSQIFGTDDEKPANPRVAKVQSPCAYILLYCVRDPEIAFPLTPVGLKNPGNRCWFNGLLQLLWSGPKITQ